ncbi:MAG TPA: hypothetical protein VIJ68_01585 [Candidatus Saccharimonadales bacterium]
MHVYFEDWTTPGSLEALTERGVPHGYRLIKVFASARNPREVLARQSLMTKIAAGGTFTPDEVYDYGDHGVYTGTEVEQVLAGYDLTNGGNHVARSLFRFSNQWGLYQAIRLARESTRWQPEGILDDIQGLGKASKDPTHEKDLHLDVFSPEALQKLQTIIHYVNPRLLLEPAVGVEWRSTQTVPGKLI